jgi:peptidoglycan/LPS O-acetylase OafA/YrhL
MATTNTHSHELKHLDYLDGWRGLAIVGVLISHFLPSTGIDLGRLGVDIFFVLSGMLMSQLLFVKRVPLRYFYKRRISRVFPVFIVYVCLIYGVAYYQHNEEASNFFYTLLFLRTYLPPVPDIWHTGLANGHLWSLNVEEQCYVLLSLITLVAFLKGREYRLLFSLVLTALAIHIFYWLNASEAPAFYYLRTEVAASYLLLSAGYSLAKSRWQWVLAPWMIVLAFIATIFCYVIKIANYQLTWLLAPFLLTITVNHLGSAPAFVLKILSSKPMCYLGLWSYSLYIWQQPFFYYGIDHGMIWAVLGDDASTIWLARLGLLAAVFLVSLVSFYCLENPVRQWLNKHW